MPYQRITASVGKHCGRKQCYNYPADQAVVQDLLNTIPAWQGGQEGRLKDPIRAGLNGAALQRLNLLASGTPPFPEPPKRERVRSSDPV
jgi:hypothetical protein